MKTPKFKTNKREYVSVRITESLKDRLLALKIDVSYEVREFLERLVEMTDKKRRSK